MHTFVLLLLSALHLPAALSLPLLSARLVTINTANTAPLAIPMHTLVAQPTPTLLAVSETATDSNTRLNTCKRAFPNCRTTCKATPAWHTVLKAGAGANSEALLSVSSPFYPIISRIWARLKGGKVFKSCVQESCAACRDVDLSQLGDLELGVDEKPPKPAGEKGNEAEGDTD
ncbi:MAG: hypothetical protein M1829_003616 [Trizodia sp. TS-e1964]|nr:MAG: hypothetical protein M1829_003616 [Trizodia sp. TS-e1964]